MDAHRPFLRAAELRRALLTFAALAGAACAGGEGPAGPPSPKPVASIVVAPGADTMIALGRQRVYTAVARDADGAVLTGVVIRWRSSDSLIARVDSTTGVVTAVANGTATIRATSGTVEGTGTVSVIQFVATVTVTPGTAGLAAIGATQAYTAVARDSANAVVNGVRFLWISSDPAVATIDTNGVARAAAPGTTTISASGRGVPAYSTLTVTQNATQLAFTTEPVNVRAGEAFPTALQVEVRDAAGSLVTASRIAVTLGLASGVDNATLWGSRTVNAVGGIATFSGNYLDRVASGRRLVVTAAGLAPDTSVAFTTRPGLPVSLVTTVSHAGFIEVGAPASGNAFVRFVDAFGNTADTTLSTTIALQDNGANAEMTYDAPVVQSPGLLRFPGLDISRPGAGYTIVAFAARGPMQMLDSSDPFSVRATFSTVRLYQDHACGLTTFTVLCWGENSNEELASRGAPSAADSIPGAVAPAGPFIAVGVSRINTCVLTVNGTANCWGSGPDGPIAGTGPGGAVLTQLSVGSTHACGLTASGAAYCWGSGFAGQLGNGGTSDASGAVLATGTGAGGIVLTSISAGQDFTCATTADGRGYCWGYNGSGQLGDSSQTSRSIPTQMAGSGPATEREFTRIVVGAGERACGISALGDVLCWGGFPVGDGSGGNSSVAVIVAAAASPGQGYLDVAVGSLHTCVLDNIHRVSCFGYSQGGASGIPGVLFAPGPVLVSVAGRQVFDIEAGEKHTCARTDNGIYCWGSNYRYSLGIGASDPASSATPIRIRQ